jgi:RNA polymerase sigma-70 factor (ECF subfamily)
MIQNGKPMNDADLIKEFRNGNRQAFSELVDRYSQPLTMMILRIVRDQEEAKDISQTVFLKVYEGLPRFMLASSFKTWLYSIAMNAVKDYLRKKRKTRASDEDPDQFPDPSESAAVRLDEARMSKSIREAMELLPEKQRLTFQLRIYENLDYKEIARVLGGTSGGARGNFFQAVKTLRARILGAKD